MLETMLIWRASLEFLLISLTMVYMLLIRSQTEKEFAVQIVVSQPVLTKAV